MCPRLSGFGFKSRVRVKVRKMRNVRELEDEKVIKISNK